MTTNNRNNMINIWGLYFLIFCLAEYIFSLDVYSIYIYFGLIGILILYDIIKFIKLSYIKIDDIVAWLILTLVSIAISFGLKYIHIDDVCHDKFCFYNSRFNFYILINLIYTTFMIVFNIIIYPIRIITKKKGKTI